jgi:hypothetical protein
MNPSPFARNPRWISFNPERQPISVLDLLLVPAAFLPFLALRAVHRGAYRQHGHLMVAALSCLFLHGALSWPQLPQSWRQTGVAMFLLFGATVLLGRGSLAWREGHMGFAKFPRLHRALGVMSLLGIAFALMAWLMARW